MQILHRASKHFPHSDKQLVNRGAKIDQDLGKSFNRGHLVTPLQQTSLHQNTFRCSDRVDQDIEVIAEVDLIG